MAIDLTLKSVSITNREATPSVANSPGRGGATKIKSVFGYFASVPASLSTTSIIRMVDVPSNAVVHRVVFESEDQVAGKFDIGVYRNNADGGAVVDVDLFASAAETAGAFARLEVTNESTNYTLDKQNQPLWEAAGLLVDPKSSLDIALTVVTTAVTTGTGKVGLLVEYTD